MKPYLLLLLPKLLHADIIPEPYCAGEECNFPVPTFESLRPSRIMELKAPKIEQPLRKPRAEKPVVRPKSNLPEEYVTSRPQGGTAGEIKILVPERQLGAALKGLKSGDMIRARLAQSIVASPSVPTPVRAEVLKGPFEGSFLLGKATLDRELKRVLVEFERMRLPRSEVTYALRASGHSPNGQVGLTGDYHSNEAGFFVAELAAAGVAGYADATIERQQNAFGVSQPDTSVNTAAKKAIVAAAGKSADRFAERARTAPEYTEISANQEIWVLITDDPKEVP